MLKEHNPTVYFATGNKNKYLEAKRIASSYRIILKHLNLEKQEIQSNNLAEIASYGAKQAAETAQKAVVAEDAGFFIDYLGGFPGPYSSYVYDTLGLEGLLKLMHNVRNRNASFQAAAAYCAPHKRPICFTGRVAGIVTTRPKGSNGFGFDPIFIPRDDGRKTFAQMTMVEKNLYSHRAKAFTKFCEWYSSKRQTSPSKTS